MSKFKDEYLNSFVVNQLPIEKFINMIKACIGIVQTFEMILNDKDYYINYTASYGIKIKTTRKPTSSKIESFMINKYDNSEKMQDFILKYYFAYDSLNIEEKRIFNETFIANSKDEEIIAKFGIYADLLRKIRKSAIARFSLILGFDKFVDMF